MARSFSPSEGRVVRPDPRSSFSRATTTPPTRSTSYIPDSPRTATRAVRSSSLGSPPSTRRQTSRALLRGSFATWADAEWEEFWEVVRRVGPERAAGIYQGPPEKAVCACAQRKVPALRQHPAAGRDRAGRSRLATATSCSTPNSTHRSRAAARTRRSIRTEAGRGAGRAVVRSVSGGRARALPAPADREPAATERRSSTSSTTARSQGRSRLWMAQRRRTGTADRGRARSETDFAPWVFCHTTQPDQLPDAGDAGADRVAAPGRGTLPHSRGLRRAPVRRARPADWAEILPVADMLTRSRRASGASDDPRAAHSDDLWEEGIAATTESTDDL